MRTGRYMLPLLFLLAIPLGAEVFQRMPGHRTLTASLRSALKTDISINGRNASIEVLTSENNYDQTMRGMQSVINKADHADVRQGTAMASITLDERGAGRTRYLVSELPTTGGTLLFREQEQYASRQADARPQHRMRVVQAYPGSTPGYHALDKGTGMEVQLAESSDPTSLIIGHYDALLRTSGWSAPMPLEKLHTQPAMLIYTRGDREMMCVSTRRDSYRRVSTITLLHKRFSVR